MNVQRVCSGAIAALFLGGATLAPGAAGAQSLSQQSHRRQQQKNQWRNIAIGSAALGALGFVKGNNTLGAAGVAGALYSANRYEQDRRSQSRIDRRRAELYGHRAYYRNGHRYSRHTVYRNGHKYYQFRRD